MDRKAVDQLYRSISRCRVYTSESIYYEVLYAEGGKVSQEEEEEEEQHGWNGVIPSRGRGIGGIPYQARQAVKMMVLLLDTYTTKDTQGQEDIYFLPDIPTRLGFSILAGLVSNLQPRSEQIQYHKLRRQFM